MQLTSCAMFAIATLSACRLNVSSVRPATSASRPLDLPADRSRPDKGQLATVRRHRPCREAPELRRVLLRREVAAAAPRLVADPPLPNPERLAIAARRALLGQRGARRRRVAVFHPLHQRP